MNEEIYEGTPAKEDALIGTNSGYNRYRRPDGSTYVHYPYSRMATVTAYSAKDRNGQPIRTADGKLIAGNTQAEADRKRFRYDMSHWVEANRRKTAHLPQDWRERLVTPDMNTFNAITGGVFNLTPIQVGRGIYNLSQDRDPGFILGNSGVVSEEYAQEHPWLALGANVLGEGLVGGGLLYGAPKLYNNFKSIYRHLNNVGLATNNVSRAANNVGKSAVSIPEGLRYFYKWRPSLPKGSENTVYRQGKLDMIDDALESGVVRPQPKALHNAKIATDKAVTGRTLLLKKYFPNAMFNRQRPFYENPKLFEKASYPGVFVGDMSKSSALWVQNFHKGHKNIFEPYIDGKIQAPVSEFDIYLRAPYNFGWFKNIRKNLGNSRVNYFKDEFGREITPTPYSGPDSELVDAVLHSLESVLEDYFSPEKIDQIKKTMGWGDLEIAELLDEILRAIGRGSEVTVKGSKDGFTGIGLHKGKIVGSGTDSEGFHTVTLNRERIPNLQIAREAGIHEIGVHGKTLSMQAEDFGKGGYSDLVREMFPRFAQITLKNADISNEILKFNRLGNYLSLFKTTSDLERRFVEKGIPWNKWDKFKNARKYFNYVNLADEKTARAYTGLLYEKVYGNDKTENIKLLERFFTPESVEAFKKAVLGATPIITATSSIPSDKKGAKILIKKKNRGELI